jgi:hypothetical protein
MATVLMHRMVRHRRRVLNPSRLIRKNLTLGTFIGQKGEVWYVMFINQINCCIASPIWMNQQEEADLEFRLYICSVMFAKKLSINSR